MENNVFNFEVLINSCLLFYAFFTHYCSSSFSCHTTKQLLFQWHICLAVCLSSRRRRRRGRGRGRSRTVAAAAAVTNASPRGGVATTLTTERTKRRRNTRNTDLTNTAETATKTHIYSRTHCSYQRKWVATDGLPVVHLYINSPSYYRNLYPFK